MLVYPNLAISTAEAYAGVQPGPETSLYDQLRRPIDTWHGRFHNDFEDSLFPNIRYWLRSSSNSTMQAPSMPA